MTKATTTEKKKLTGAEVCSRIREAKDILFLLSYDLTHSESGYTFDGFTDEHAICLLRLIKMHAEEVGGAIDDSVHKESEACRKAVIAKRNAERNAERGED